MALLRHCGRPATGAGGSRGWTSAPIAPAARHHAGGNRRTDLPSTPPSAPLPPARRAANAHRSGRNPGAPGWLAVANTGERNTSGTPARRARSRSPSPWAEAVSGRSQAAGCPTRRPARRCRPARSAAASRQSPATDKASRRARQSRAIARPSSSRSGTASSRSTTPASPRGSRRIAASGSGTRAVSVNSQSGGSAEVLPRRRALTARAQATSL